MTREDLLKRISINPKVCFGKLWSVERGRIREYRPDRPDDEEN